MQLLYFPGPDILEVHLDETSGAEVETLDGPTEHLFLHFKGGRLVGLTLEHAVETGPAAWHLSQVRHEVVELANTRDESITSVSINEQGEILGVQKGGTTASKPDLIDEAVDVFRDLTRRRVAE